MPTSSRSRSSRYTPPMEMEQCSVHGPQQRTFVCQHIALTLHDRQPRGFFWSAGAPNDRGDAWCSACDAVLMSSGGEWTADAESKAGAKIQAMCGVCYDEARRINGF